MILSAASPVFQNVLNRNPHNHPLLYFHGISKKDIEVITNFIYSGETQVPMDGLDTFLNFAKAFKLKGLVEDKVSIDSVYTFNSFDEKDENHTNLKREELIDYEVAEEKFETICNKGSVAIEASSNQTELCLPSPNIKELNKKINSILVKSADGSWSCKECSYAAKQKCHVKEHVEGHIEGFLHPCHLCAKTFRKRNVLRMHIPKCLKKINNATIKSV